jgi:hypothetical protein
MFRAENQFLATFRLHRGICKGFNMPTSTDVRIEELCARIRFLCSGPLAPAVETKLRKLAVELRDAINEHVQIARSSLGAKNSAIIARDPDKK